MTGGLRQRMTWLHAWCGLVCAWLLCMIFLAGTISVFRAPISRWMTAEPPLPPTAAVASPADVLAAAARHLERQGPGARFWRIELPAQDGQAMRLFWSGAQRGASEAAMDPRNGEVLPQPWGRKTEGGRHFMTLHYTLHAGDFGFWLVGWLSVGMLVALLSGVVVHKRIFKDFFTFRPGRGQRAWLDGHNASAVLALPFHLMIVYTGLAIFYTSYMPGPLRAVYGEDGAPRWHADLADQADRGAAAAPWPAPPRLSPALPPRAQLGAVMEAAQAALASPARMIVIERPGQAQERISVYARPDEAASARRLMAGAGRVVYRGTTGEVVAYQPADAGTASADVAHDVMERLHLAAYGGWTIKWLYFVSGLAGTLMIATGAVLYTVKRRMRSDGAFGAATPHFVRMTEAINVAAIAGACIACIAYFHANRLIPAAMPGRDAWEIKAFFAAWLATLLHALVRPARRAWLEQTGCAGLLCLALPVVNALTTGQHGVAYALAGNWTSAAVEWSIVAVGVAFVLLTGRLARGDWAKPAAARVAPAAPGYRWRVLGRVVVAILGGYALTTVAATVLAQLLAASGASSPPIAVVVATLVSFLVYAILAMWVFAARGAWLALLAALAVLTPIAWLLGAA